MKKAYKLLFLTGSILFFCTQVYAEESEIKKLWANYIGTLKNLDEKKIPDYLDTHTFYKFQRLIDDAAYSNKTELELLNILEKFYVIRLRHAFKKEELFNLTSKKLLAMSYKLKLLMVATDEKELKNIRIKGNKAYATIASKHSFPELKFVKEEGEWKFSLWDTSEENAIERIEKSMNALKKDEYSMIRYIIEWNNIKYNDKTLNGPLE